MLADAIGTALPDLRVAAESLMTSTCTIRADDGAEVTDPESGEVTRAPGTEVYSGPCRVRQPGNWGRTAEAGGEQISPNSFQVSVPFAVSTVERGHRVTVDASDDPQLVGRTFTVRFSPVMGAHITARRLICEEL